MSVYQYAVIHRPQLSAKDINIKAEEVLTTYVESRDLTWAPVVDLKAGVNYFIQNKAGSVTGLVSIADNRIVFLIFGVEAADDAWTAESDIRELMEGAFPGSVEA
ncbi:hypothetical protein ACIQYF_01155 [Pseudomonas sp. NPDC096917]|uniref:hypothetical protein n=1 Tax=Pseudomonas sp. NPDC096917 TaxID=3364483 RepID=UPI00383AC772